jgi:hypothetical protein
MAVALGNVTPNLIAETGEQDDREQPQDLGEAAGGRGAR